MKAFKKRHDYLPSRETVLRLIRRYGDESHLRRYHNWMRGTFTTLPMKIRELTLCRPDPNKRQNIQYFPDLRTFLSHDEPNRSLPVGKFLDLFRGLVPQEELDEINRSMTDFRLLISKEKDHWMEVYADENCHSCMSPSGERAQGQPLPACYAHPENNLAIAALYPPGSNQVIARTIVNTEEKWYVRLFGDRLLVEKLQELGYHKMHKPAREFKMYAYSEDGDCPQEDADFKMPYFDFVGHDSGRLRYRLVPNTYNRETGFAEAIVNPGVT